jgi:hypothetical protein
VIESLLLFQAAEGGGYNFIAVDTGAEYGDYPDGQGGCGGHGLGNVRVLHRSQSQKRCLLERVWDGCGLWTVEYVYWTGVGRAGAGEVLICGVS